MHTAQPVYGTVEGQLYIGGVFVKLFIKQPNWGLRSPKEFCTALLEKYAIEKSNRARAADLVISPYVAWVWGAFDVARKALCSTPSRRRTRSRLA